MAQVGACASANSTITTITVNPVTIPGTVTPGTAVCFGSNFGTITLSGHNGSISRWEVSSNGGATWNIISSSNANQIYSNLTSPNWYRALVVSGVCSSAYSDTAMFTIDAQTIPGTVTASDTVCAGANGAVLNLNGNNGNVVRWQFSTNGGATWNNITNTTTSHSYNNITTSTRYRAQVQNGVCPLQNSVPAIITVDQQSQGGAVISGDTVCAIGNSGSVTLNGHLGAVTGWEESTDAGTSWSPIANTTTTQAYTNLTQTTWYRATVQNGVCPSAISIPDSVYVVQFSVGGNLIPSALIVCAGANNDTVTLNGNVGSIMHWEYSTDGGNTWVVITNSTNQQVVNNTPGNIQYRTLVKSGLCPSVYSDTATVLVDLPSDAGTISGSAQVCDGGNSGSVQLSGITGTVQGWETSTDNIVWTPTGNNTTTETYTNLTATTYYRAIVGNGVCQDDTSSTAIIQVAPSSVGGTLTPGSLTLCSGANNGTITLSGHTGSVQAWEYSTDGGSSWIATTNSSASQSYLNLNTTTLYRAIVKSSFCPVAFSDTAQFIIDTPSSAGTISGSAQVCDGGNSGSVQISGFNGTITGWESSIDNINWTPTGNNTATENYNNLTTTTYYRAIVQNGVCSSDTSATATIQVAPSTVGGTLTPPNLNVCAGSNNGSITLSGETGTVQAWEFSTDGGNTWITTSNNTNTQTYLNLNVMTQYRARVQSAYCPVDYSTVSTINVDQPNNAGMISGNLDACDGVNSDSLTLINFTGVISGWESSTDGISWSATGNTTDREYYSGLTQNTWYRVIVGGGSCPNDTAAAVEVIIHPNPVASFTANDVCDGNAVNFTSTSTITSGNINTYDWNFGDSNTSSAQDPDHTYNTSGVFHVTLTVTSDRGCTDMITDSVEVFENPDAQITASGSLIFCAPDTVVLTAPANLTYLWSTGETTQSVTIDTTMLVIVVVTDPVTGCTAEDFVEVTVNYAIPVTVTPDTSISLGLSIELSAEGGDFFNWTPGATLSDSSFAYPVATPLVTTTYTVYSTDMNGCVDSANVTVTVNEDFNFVIANLMTPNGDGYNDTWKVKNIENYPNNEVVIFNRYGMEVFKTTGYNNTWDGTYNGGKLPDGTYHYILKFNNGDKVYKGSITILSGE